MGLNTIPRVIVRPRGSSSGAASTCAGGGAEELTTGALTAAAAAEEDRKSPDRISRASPVPMEGCTSARRREKRRNLSSSIRSFRPGKKISSGM